MNFTDIIIPNELNIWIEQEKAFQLIDISEENLLQSFGIQSDWIPVSKLLVEVARIEKNKPVVLCCRYGSDSFMLMNILRTQYQLTNVFSLKSGVSGWKLLSKT